MTTLNDHAQESESRFSCLSAANPENIPDVRKEKMIRSHQSTEVKQTAAACSQGGADDGVTLDFSCNVIFGRSHLS